MNIFIALTHSNASRPGAKIGATEFLRYMQFMSEVIKEYAIIRVIALNSDVPEAVIEDQGAVLVIFGERFKANAYEVECVNVDGTNKWLGTFSPNQIELVKNV